MVETKLKKDDLVKILIGKDRGKTGRIIEIDRENGRVLVEGCNIKKKTVRPKSQQEKGGIIEIEGPISISNVGLVGKDGKPTRLGYKDEAGKKVRFAKSTGESV
ncbi:MAG: 50S ribosomal protein L24 [Spirochaetes bacterium GWB1_48_6]|nr:MAG: 50S ribosomal protein L24 [Spirochaetes bacterium GWB1_48_6]